MLDFVEDHSEVLVAEGGSRSSESSCERWRHVIVSIEFGTRGMLKSMFFSSVARLNSLSALNDAMSRCSAGTNCSFTMCLLALDFTGSPATRCLQNFGENLRQMAFKNSFYFVTDSSFLADGGLLWLTVGEQERLSKFCTDAGFLTTVEIGQYFMTKDTEEFSQFTDSVACREYTLPRDESSSDPKGWIRGSTKIGPVLEVTTSYLQGKYGVEIRIKSVNKENSHSWVRISHVLKKKNWSRTWTTRTKTTTSRKPQKCSSKNMR